MVDVLTPHLLSLGLKREKMGRGEGSDWLTGWLPPASTIGSGPGSEDIGGGSLSAGCLAGMDVDGVVTSDSGSSLEGTGGLRLSLYPISPRLVGNGSAGGRVVGSCETMGNESVAMASKQGPAYAQGRLRLASRFRTG